MRAYVWADVRVLHVWGAWYAREPTSVRRAVLVELDEKNRLGSATGRSTGVLFFGTLLATGGSLGGALLLALFSAYLVGFVDEFGLTTAAPEETVQQLNHFTGLIAGAVAQVLILLLGTGVTCYVLGLVNDISQARVTMRLDHYRQVEERLAERRTAGAEHESRVIPSWLGFARRRCPPRQRPKAAR